METQQAQFSGWAKVEVMGHQSHVGYVTTEVYGQAVLFRIDRPAVAESEETLTESEWVGDQYCKPGSIIIRAGIEAQSVLVGSNSIYRIIPCDEATAMRAIQTGQRRPLMVVKLVGTPLLQAVGNVPHEDDDSDDDTEGSPF